MKYKPEVVIFSNKRDNVIDKTTSYKPNSLFPNVNPNDITLAKYSKHFTPPRSNVNMEYNHPHHNNATEHHHDNKYNIDGKPLTDQEYIYNSQRHHVNTNTFYKLRWGTKYQNELEILPFYKTLQYMAATCIIHLRNLEDIDEFNGVCPLTRHNCTNYDKAYKLTSGAIFL